MDEGTIGEEAAVESMAGEWEARQWRLERYRKAPIDLNHASSEEMSELGMLTPVQIEAWLYFRKQFGAAETWYVFQSVPGWTERVVEQIRPYCRLGVRREGQKGLLMGPAQHMLLLRVGVHRNADLPISVAGANVHRFLRYRWQSEKGIELGLLLESDAGETLAKRGPDFISGFIKGGGSSGGKLGWLVGDFSVQLGQGLSCWQGMAFGPGSDLTAIKRQGLAIRPYQSVGESRFMRGIAISGKERRWCWDVFLSRNQQTSTFYRDGEGRSVFRRVNESGYHRTPSELERKDNLKEFSFGGRIGRTHRWGRTNLNFIGRQWSVPRIQQLAFQPSDTVRNPRVGSVGIDYSFTWGGSHGFGELAIDGQGKVGVVMGIVSVLDRSLDFSIQSRWVGRGFESVDAQPFQQAAPGQSEKGLYTQLRYRVSDHHLVDLYADLFSTPALDSWISNAAAGWLKGFRWQFQPDKKNALYLRFQSTSKEIPDQRSPMAGIVERQVASVRVHGQFAVQEKTTVSCRLEQLVLKTKGARDQTGFLGYLECRREFLGGSFVADVRLQWASTDGWESRIYAFERDVLYKVGFPAFYGRSVRSYLNCSGKLGRKIAVWIKVFIDKNVDNQRHNSVMPDFRSGITFQVRYQWEKGGL